jgi:hypothetical protein
MSVAAQRVVQAIRSRLAISACLAILGSWALAGQADAYVFWGTNTSASSGGGIGRAHLDGSGVDYQFIRLNTALAVTTRGSYIYWSSGTGAIGRSKIAGTGVKRKFIRAGSQQVKHLAADGRHIYWTHGPFISRAKLDGSGVAKNIVKVSSAISGLSLDAHHIYWSQVDNHSIGRAKLNGTGVDESFIATGGTKSHPQGVAVNASHVYWSDYAGTIGRANIDGNGVDGSFITSTTGSPMTGGIALDAAHVYWTSTTAISRAGIDGQNVEPTFIDQFGANRHGEPVAVVVDRR